MKKILKVAVPATFTVLSSLAAAGAYMGVAAGQAEIDLESYDEDTSFAVTAGYMFDEYFGAEVSYVNLGQADWDDSAIDRDWSIKADGIDFSIVGRLPIGERFAVFGKAGVLMWDAKVSLPGVPDNSYNADGKDASFAGGAAFNVTESLGINVQYQYFEVDNEDVENYVLGVTYGF